jgi:hypothetical protein
MRLLPSVALAAALLALISGSVRAATIRGYDPGPRATHSATAPTPDAGAARGTAPGATSRGVAVDPTPSAVEHEPAADGPDQAPADTAVGDPLVGNGLGGALCRNAQLASGLSAAAQRNCQTAGTAAASAPVGHYGFDVHIDTGTLGVSSRTLLVAVQTLLLTPLWTLLLWLTNATLSLLEWAFAIDLLDPATMGSAARTLAAMRATVTEPWLVALLALAAIALLYHAIVRRRIADSVGEVAAMTAMILAGLWIITNPAGTVGEVNRALNQTGLSAVAAVSAGDPGPGRAAFGDGLRTIFATAIQGPWCYLEFGDVDWCRNPERLDPQLAQTGQRLRTELLKDARCDPLPPALCSGAADEPSRDARLLAEARSNGELFLALPTNSGHRNAINGKDSLYRTLCGNDDDNHCHGATAQAAQWRTESGTWPRAGGLMLIAVGSVGMLALLLFIALRLLGAAILTVVYLLLAPLAVLAPTIGESGRAAFRGWATRLLGALVAKLIYALFLGVVLLTLSILDGLDSLGWWTQWLLIAAFWWIVFVQRHEVLAYARLGHAETGARGLRLAGGVLAARQLTRTLGETTSPARRLVGRAGHTTVHAVGATHQRLAEGRTANADRRHDEELGRARAADRGQAERLLTGQQRVAAIRVSHAPSLEADLGVLDARRPRIASAIAGAHSSGNRQHALRLLNRDTRLRRGAEQRRDQLGRSHDAIARAADARRATGRAFSEQDLEQAGLLLDREALKRRGVVPGPRADADAYRAYDRLAPLADLSSDAYRALSPGEQRRARLTIDRELEARRTRIAARPAASTEPDDWSTQARTSAARRAPETALERRRRQLGQLRDHRSS